MGWLDEIQSKLGGASDSVKEYFGWNKPQGPEFTDVAAPPSLEPEVQSLIDPALTFDPVTRSTNMAASLPIRSSDGPHFDWSNKEEDFEKAMNSIKPDLPAEQPEQTVSQLDKLIMSAMDRKPRLFSVPEKSSNDNKPIELEVGEGTKENTVEALKDAQSNRNIAQLINNLGAAGTQYVAGQAGFGAQADTSAFDKLNQQADNIVKDQQARGEQEKKDPKSPVSQAYRKYLQEKFGVNIKGEVSADQLEKLYPMIQRSYENEELRKSREDQNRQNIMAMNERALASAEDRKATLAMTLMNREEMKRNRDENLKERQDQFDQRQATDYQKAADKETADIRKVIEEGETFNTLTEQALTNPMAANQLGITLAKTLGEKGALSAADVTRYIDRKDLAGQAANAYNRAVNGTLRPEDKEYLGEITQIIQGRAREKMGKAYQRWVERYANNIGANASDEKIVNRIVPPSDAGLYNVYEHMKSNAPSRMVRVYNVETGKTGSIPEDKLQAALNSKKFKLHPGSK